MEKWTLENIIDPPLHIYISSTLTCNWHHFLRTHDELLGFFFQRVYFLCFPHLTVFTLKAMMFSQKGQSHNIFLVART